MRDFDDIRFHITTFGCQMNEHDSEIMGGLLAQCGLSQVSEWRDADLEIINTCSVRENADKRFFGTLGQLKKRRKSDPGFIVAVCGCMMQQPAVVQVIRSRYPWVDIVFGTHNIEALPELLRRVLRERRSIIEVLPDTDTIPEGLPSKRLHKHKALVNIMFGCNNFCSYCIVPYTRGREKSRDPGEIIKEIRALAGEGVREVLLLGQNVNSYRFENCDFAGLLHRVNDIEGIERIRFMTSHPKDLSEDLIKAFGECGRLCHNIHLPVQSGSNEVLRRMNRRYTRERYLATVRALREAVPDITLSTDIIVGFPGETEDDFEATLDIVRQVRYDSAFTFLYSRRPGTPAAAYAGQVPEEIKHRRFNRLVDILDSISAEKNAAYVGRVEKVLVEGPSKNDAGRLSGRTDGFKLVNFDGDRSLIGQMTDVRITGSRTFSLEGEALTKGEAR